jgi:two-component system OmpR family response regulator/two-component system response regulator QseB
MSVARILLVEYVANSGNSIGPILVANGWLAETINDGPAAVHAVATSDYALVLIDVSLSELEVDSLLRSLMAARPGQRLIVIDDRSGTGEQAARWLDAGASDYLRKPVPDEELLAVINARLRSPPYMRRRGVTLDLSRRRADAGNGQVSLTNREFVVLAHLMTNEGVVFTRDELLASLWGLPGESATTLVECYIARLRAKLGDEIISTVWKRGYVFVGTVPTSAAVAGR